MRWLAVPPWGNTLLQLARQGALFLLSDTPEGNPRKSFSVSGNLFLRGLGFVFLAAFLSAGVQILGLIGSHGILPLESSLKGVAANYGAKRFFFLPTLFWLNASDSALQASCGLGALASLSLLLGFAPRLCLFLNWILYLSLVTGGAEFFNFQWDFLLLETSFAALFLAPASLRPSLRTVPLPPLLRFLFLWILFRVVFFSGAVKLLSGDPAWGSLTALRYFFQCQPLPNPLSWWVQQAPEVLLKTACFLALLVELAVPLLMLLYRKLRLAAFVALVLYQMAIMLSGNTNFFNLTVILLALFLLDDEIWSWLSTSFHRFPLAKKSGTRAPTPLTRIRWAILPYALFIGIVTGLFLASDLGFQGPWPGVLLGPYRLNVPLRITSHYGYTLSSADYRREIIVEGSRDGKDWKEYGFRWYPGDPKKAPRFAGLHQPRLDAQMWLAAYGTCEDSPWFQQLLGKLLTGSPSVLALFESNPFTQSPPAFVRARLYDFRFTDYGERKKTGEWWTRIERGQFCQEISIPQDKATSKN